MADLTVQDIKKLKDESKRGFDQTIDLAITIQGLDVKKPENRMREAIRLPHKVKDAKVCFIVEGLFGLATQTKNKVLSKNDLDFKKREGRNLSRDYDFFAIETPLMPTAAKALGKYIGPRNKQMMPVPPTLKDLKPFTEGLNYTVQINITKAPTVQIPIGKTSLKDEQILENYNYLMEKLKTKLEPKKAQIKSIIIKTTMGKPVKVL